MKFSLNEWGQHVESIPYTEEDNTIILRNKYDMGVAAYALNRTRNAVYTQYSLLQQRMLTDPHLRAIAAASPFSHDEAYAAYAQVRKECPYVSTAQGRWQGRYFVSVAYKSRGGGIKIDEVLLTPQDWGVIKPEVVAAFERGRVAA